MLRYTYIACLVFAYLQVTYILVNFDFVKKFIVRVMRYMEIHCSRLKFSTMESLGIIHLRDVITSFLNE